MQKVFTLPEGIEATDGIAVRVIVPTRVEVAQVVVAQASTGVHIAAVEVEVRRTVIVESSG